MKKLDNHNFGARSFKDSDIEQKIMERASGFRVPAGRSGEEAMLLLKTKISEREKEYRHPGFVSMRMVQRVSSIAACVLLLFGLWQLLNIVTVRTIEAGNGKHKEYRLPDGSAVSLNADSKMTFNKKDFTSERHIDLKGEAFFDVAGGKTFTISTKNGDIKVLGTSFNILSRENTFKVSCLTGKILVSSGNRSVIIVPGETAQLSGKDLISFNDKNLASVTGWLNGEFYFENSPLDFVFDEIERQFNVKFESKSINKYFTGSFTNKDLESALEIVCIPMGLKYEIGRKGKISVSKIGQ